MLYLLKSKLAKIILSVIWGLGLASLFKKVCKERECIICRAPNTKDLNNNTYQFSGKCFQFEPELSYCSKKTVDS